MAFNPNLLPGELDRVGKRYTKKSNPTLDKLTSDQQQ